MSHSSVPRPHPSRLDPRRDDYEAIISAHQSADARGETTYEDPSTGFLVMAHHALLARGFCCSQKCRHCPYIEDPTV